ncbi:MAG TPA: S8 family serine peptidase, partial [Humisphaera sp.]|nr:S8 family serine peptidase [Humisphaera sp.]
MHASNNTRRVRSLIAAIETLELRTLLSAAFDITSLTALRNNPAFSNITGQGVGIAVLDTGVDAKNPDLSANVVAFYNAVENQPTGATTAVANAVDGDGHGSHVSGIAASSNPAIGVAYGAKLIDIKVIPDANESQLGGDPLLRGLEWVAMNYTTYNIKVVNMSLGEPGVNENAVTSADTRNAEAVEIKTLQNLGITVVSASGNSYANAPTAGESFPAVVSTIGVANTWANSGQASDFNVPYGESGDTYYAIDYSATPDTLASTSQRSTLNNQLAAPGEDIYSTWNGTLDSSNGSDLLHNTISGTSMATPFVSGVVALMQDAAKYFGGH